VLHPGELVSHIAILNVKYPGESRELFNSLAEGNAGIYRDIFWTFLAFEKGMRTTKVLKDLDVPVLLKNAWNNIENKKILEGTQDMVKEEQIKILQPIFGYDEGSARRRALRNTSFFIKVVKDQELFPGMPRFQGGDFGNADQRLEWTRQIAVVWDKYQRENRREVMRTIDSLIADGKRAAAGN
jgi:hypothetical protein